MIKHIFRNLTRFKGATFLNVIGLSSAFAVFIIISMQIRYDLNYDTYHKDHDRIYQFTRKNISTGESYTWLSRPSIREMRNSIPELNNISLLKRNLEEIIRIINDEGDESVLRDVMYSCGDEFFKVFTFDFIEGDESVLKDWNNIIISDRFAKKYYGDKSPIGKLIKNGRSTYTIAAVYKAFPISETIKGDLFVNIGNENIDNYDNSNYAAFFKTDQQEIDAKELDRKLMEQFMPESLNEDRTVYANPVKLTDIRYVIEGKNPYTVYAMFLLVISILVLALINFVNFSISMVPLKVKGINIRKVVGESDNKLRMVVIVEALFLTVFSFLVALFLVELFRRNSLSSIISDMSWVNNHLIYYIAFGVSILAGILAGLYPAFYSTSFSPALVLKSSFALSAKGRLFRKYLIGFQFLVAIAFIAISLFIQLQYNYLLTRDGGYNKEGILHIDHGWSYVKHDALKMELLTHSDIKDVTFARDAFGVLKGSMSWGRATSKGTHVQIDPVFPVAHNFLDFFEIEIIEGRDFIFADEYSEHGCWIMGKLTMEQQEININEKIPGHNDVPTDIVGVCENVNALNLKTKLKPFGFFVFGKNPWSYLPHCYVKFLGNPEEVIKHIKDSYKATDPNSFIAIEFMGDELKAAYAEEENMKKIMQSLSLIAIVIALLGVYGLVVFDTRFRRKEISLRKINGASVSDVLAMFSVAYLKIVLISFVISISIVFVVVRDWLSAFPYKIPIYWWVFLLAFLFVALLTLAISLVQTYTTARENPINQLKEN